MHSVSVDRDRPDFRVFIDLLYGFGRRTDKDGDANPVNSRTWNWLYLSDRESEDPAVRIYADDADPAAFSVKSASPRLEALSALYLFLYCGVSMAVDGVPADADAVAALKEKYRVELARADGAIWHQSSDERPYPNLE